MIENVLTIVAILALGTVLVGAVVFVILLMINYHE
jgi:preprotein translocase subunit Sss1